MAIRQSEALLDPPGLSRDARAGLSASDDHLLAQFIADRDECAQIAFAALVRRHGPMVLHVCRQVVGDLHTAEDAFQATFLILVRRAGSIQKPELLGNWLHGVALRTAREARMRDERRRRHESPGTATLDAQASAPASRPELALVRREEFETLHDEVSRLPERYRVPVVLCDLEGLTYAEAAQRLRCPVATIGVRLRRARERLRERLTRRGLAPTAGLVGALLGAEVARAQVPSQLFHATVEAAMGLAAGEAATTGLLSVSVATLTEAVLKLMFLTRLKVAMSIALAIGAGATFAWVGLHRQPNLAAAHARRIAQPAAATAPAAGNAAAPRQDSAPGRDEGQPPAKPAAPGLGHPRDESPHLGNASGTILAAAAGRAQPSDSSASGNAKVVGDAKNEGVKPAAAVAAKPKAIREAEQARGAALFAKEWMPNTPATHGGDGLGPVYNDTSCVACHGLGGAGGAGPESKNVILMTANPGGCGPSRPLDEIHPGFRGSRSAVLHRYGTDPAYERWRSRFLGAGAGSGASVRAKIQALKTETAAERKSGDESERRGSMDGVAFRLVERNTPPLFGLGLIDEIPTAAIVQAAASQPSAVRGRVSRTREGRIGRFGWKAQVPSLHAFVRGACANELGLEVPGTAQAISPLAPAEKAEALDLDEPDCDALVAYIRGLPAPVVIDPSEPTGARDLWEGRRLFADAGCASCHSPTLGDIRGIYSDLLLHDMGSSLSDSGSTYGSGPDLPDGPKADEWRTSPLWGFRDSGPYLHDGRARNLEEAVAFHEGQSARSARQFFGLSPLQRARLEAFLKSLVAPAQPPEQGIRLAAELETAFATLAQRSPEAVVRLEREKTVAHDEQEWRDAQRRRRALDAAKRARVQIPIAQSLEKMGKITGALAFYRDIARQADGTDEGRLAAARIAALSTQAGSGTIGASFLVDVRALSARSRRSSRRLIRPAGALGAALVIDTWAPSGFTQENEGSAMPHKQRLLVFAAIVVGLSTTGAAAGASGPRDDKDATPAEVTIKGNVLCNRATDTKDWYWDPKDGDHTPVIYAIEGTPEIDAQVRTIMEGYPERGLGVDDALSIQNEFTKYIKYFIAPGPSAEKIHKDVEAGSRLLALTGKISERDGKRWINVARYEPAKVSYPEKMLRGDQPFAPAGKEPLVLKINDTLTLKCILLPPGRFLQGSSFYQRRYQDEYPHEVVLTKPFFMSEVPVTQEIFEAVMGKNPAQSQGAQFPVEHVPFADILEFCRILSQRNGVTVRLPSDAEWEYAARVGTSNPCLTEKYKDQISETGGKSHTTPVRSKAPNAWGLYDMLCGGWHVTSDFKSDNVRFKQVDPKGPAKNDPHVHGDATGRLHKTRGGWHYDHMRPNMHGAATDVGTIWEGGSGIFRVVVSVGATGTSAR